MNSCNQIGNLVADPETRTSEKGTPITTWRMAINNSGGDDIFIDVTAFGKTAEFVANHFHKGKAIFVTSRLNQDNWEDKQTGKPRSKHSLIADRVGFCGSKADNEGAKGAKEEDPFA